MSVIDILFGRADAPALKDDESRPVKMVKEKENVWRVVYADAN